MFSLICFALKEEAAPFRKIAAAKPGVTILLTGIGRQNAEKSIREGLALHSPKLVLTCGFAGGLNPELRSGEIVFAADEPTIRERLFALGAKPAKFFCAPRIATSAAEKQELRRTTGADAVEMESEVIQNICRQRGIPCATIRVISDTANEDLPLDFNELANVDLSLNYGKLVLAVAKSPGKIPALLRLQKKCSHAAQCLAEVLNAVISQP